MQIKLAIADDHPMIVDGLKSILSEYGHITFCGAYTNGEALIAGLANETPDVLLLDIQMPGKSGDELLPLLLKCHPDLKVLTLTNFDSVLYVSNMLQRGAKGYLLKTADKSVLIQAIETVFHNVEFVDRSLQDKLQRAKRNTGRVASKMSLTGREKEILQYIVYGNTNPEIAEQIQLSVHTVENYRDSILLKLDVKNTAALVRKALQLGLVE